MMVSAGALLAVAQRLATAEEELASLRKRLGEAERTAFDASTMAAGLADSAFDVSNPAIMDACRYGWERAFLVMREEVSE